ncbi:hypothetical protein D3C87_378870 [compost metagenome]
MIKTDIKLAVVHNLSERSLRYADKLGGLACPSIAIVRNDIGMPNFGEITLIAQPNFANPRKVSVFDADVYSSRKPSTFFKVDKNSFRKKIEELVSASPEFKSTVFDSGLLHEFETKSLDEICDYMPRSALFLSVVFARHLGLNPRVPMTTSRPRDVYSLHKPIQQWFAKHPNEGYEVGNANFAKLGDILLSKIESDVDEMISYYKLREKSRQDNAEISSELNDDLSERDAIRVEKFSDDLKKRYLNVVDGITYPNQYVCYNIGQDCKLIRNKENIIVDNDKLHEYAQKITKKHKERFLDWVTNNFSPVIKGEFFRADANNMDGYVVRELTLSNLVKEMGRSIRNAEEYNYGAGNVRAVVAHQFRSFNEMEGMIRRIVPDSEFDISKDALNKKLLDLSGDFAQHRRYRGGSIFDASDAFCDGLKEYVRKGRRGWLEVYDDESIEKLDVVNEFLAELKSAPTTYFEAKFKTAVSLSEFSAAIVPNNISKGVLEILKKNGLAITKYEYHNDVDRLAALNQHDNLMFGSEGPTEVPSKINPNRVREKAAGIEPS